MNGLTKNQELGSIGVYNMNNLKLSEKEKQELREMINRENLEKERKKFEKEKPIDNILLILDEL